MNPDPFPYLQETRGVPFAMPTPMPDKPIGPKDQPLPKNPAPPPPQPPPAPRPA